MCKPEVDLNFRGYFEDDRHFAPCVKSVCFNNDQKQAFNQPMYTKIYTKVISRHITIYTFPETAVKNVLGLKRNNPPKNTRNSHLILSLLTFFTGTPIYMLD